MTKRRLRHRAIGTPSICAALAHPVLTIGEIDSGDRTGFDNDLSARVALESALRRSPYRRPEVRIQLRFTRAIDAFGDARDCAIVDGESRQQRAVTALQTIQATC